MRNHHKEGSALRATTAKASDVGATVELFANRIQRRLKEHEAKVDESQKEAHKRQALMLQAMNTIRKALNETSKIKLGDRFRFELEVSDWEGWPRINLNLRDQAMPDALSHSLIILAHDRHGMGTIQFGLLSEKVLGRVHLKDRSEFDRLPLVLKRCIREFLDIITPFVLNPPNEKDCLSSLTKPLEEAHLQAGEARTDGLAGVDLFADDNLGDDNLVTDTEVAPLGAIS